MVSIRKLTLAIMAGVGISAFDTQTSPSRYWATANDLRRPKPSIDPTPKRAKVKAARKQRRKQK